MPKATPLAAEVVANFNASKTVKPKGARNVTGCLEDGNGPNGAARSVSGFSGKVPVLFGLFLVGVKSFTTEGD